MNADLVPICASGVYPRPAILLRSAQEPGGPGSDEGHRTPSEEGFVDEPYKRYLSRMEVARRIVKPGCSTERRDVRPAPAEPLMVLVREQTDGKIYRHFLMRGPATLL